MRAHLFVVVVTFSLWALVDASMGAAQTERVPDAAVVNGVPQGMFVGRSLLTGRAVCLLFLSGGRITRAIPDGGLENFDWNRHRATHGPDSGAWQMRSGQLVVSWGDGGVHQGPITEHPDGIEFYGKRYSKPAAVTVAALAGRWEAAQGTAIAGGAGINRATELTIASDGRYQWTGTTGGAVAGRAVANDRTTSGTVTVRGLTIIFTSDAGTTTTHTLLPAAGSPVNAFSVGSDMFTRTSAAAPAAPPPPPSSSSSSNRYQGLSFALPTGWTSAMQQGPFTISAPKAVGDANVVLFVHGAERLSGSVDEWLRAKMTADLEGMTVLQSTPSTRTKSGALDVLSTGRTVRDQRGAVLFEIYYAIADGQRAGLAMVATASQGALTARMPAVQAFFQSVRFDGQAVTPPGTPASADIVGHWDHANPNRLVAPSPTGTTAGYAQGYTFAADETQTYAFIGLIDRVHFNESDSGTWAVENGQLVIRSRERNRTRTFQIVHFQTTPEGTTMTLLLSDYPPTDSNINTWGERYLRKGK